MRRLPPSRRALVALLAACALAASTASAALAHTDYAPSSLFGEPTGYATTCPDGSGGVIVVWAEARGGFTLHVYAQRLDALGNALWTPGGAPVGSSTDPQQTPAVAPDGAGGAIVTWSDPVSGSSIVAQRLSAAGAALWSGAGVSVCSTGFGTLAPTIAPDGSGGAIVAWMDNRNESAGDLYAQRLDASGAAQWTANGVPVCTIAGSQLWPSAIPDGEGGAVITWDDDRFTGRTSPFAQRIGSDGGAQWTANGLLLGDSPTGGGRLVPASDGHHGAFVTWTTASNVPIDSVFVYVQRVDSAGTLRFGAAAERTDSQPGWHQTPTLTEDGAGGAIVAWQDPRGPVYAQRVTADGAGLWSSSATAVSGASGRFPMIARDDLGGAIVAWWQSDAGTTHAWAQRLDSSGARAWGAGGVHVAPPDTTQLLGAVMADGSGGAYVTWNRKLGAIADSSMFVTRLSSAGFALYPETGVRLSPAATTASPGVGPPLALALDRPRPDPASGPFVVSFTLPDEGPATLELVDAAGRRVESHALEDFAAGPHAVAMGAGRRLAPGVYLVRLAHGGATLARKVRVVR